MRDFLSGHIDFAAIATNLRNGSLHALALSATNYRTGTTVVFYDGAPEVDPWIRSYRMSRRATLGVGHVLASAAIPVFFQPVKLDGVYYGDGCVRLTTPLSPALHLGAERVLAIGIRHRRPDEQTLALNQGGDMAGISLIEYRWRDVERRVSGCARYGHRTDAAH